jgi:hypothetical protein
MPIHAHAMPCHAMPCHVLALYEYVEWKCRNGYDTIRTWILIRFACGRIEQSYGMESQIKQGLGTAHQGETCPQAMPNFDERRNKSRSLALFLFLDTFRRSKE